MTQIDDKTGGRKIADSEHNIFVKNGSGKHHPTHMIPESLRQPRAGTQEKEKFRSVHNEVLGCLTDALGSPYYADSGFILYQGDCEDILPRLEDSDFKCDLTITSPPYNIGKEYENKLSLGKYISWCSAWMHRIYNVTRDSGAFWLNLGYLEVEGKGLCVPIPYLLWDKSPFYLLQEIVWKYGAGVTSKKRLAPRNEKWLYFVKDRTNYTFNLDDIRDSNVKYPNQRKNGKFRCNPLGKNPSDVWEFPKVTTGCKRSSKERTKHPAQFPLKIVERIIRACSNESEIVFDPFAGSCSAGIAAVSLGRVFVGIEKSPGYCRMAMERHNELKMLSF